MKNVKKLLAASILMFVVFAFVSCKKDKDNTSGTHKVMYKAVATNGTITDLAYTTSNGDTQTATGLNVTTWSSDEMTVSTSAVKVLNFGGNATGVDETSKITVQILVDGKVVKENSGTGSVVMSAVTSYSF